MLIHYLKGSLRDFKRHRTSTFISVFGLALGISCFIAALGAFVYLTNGEPHFANANRIYAITEGMHPRNVQDLDFASLRSSAPVARYLRLDFPQLEAVAAARDVQEIPVAAGEQLGYLHAAAVDPEFLKIFNFAFAESSAPNPLSIARGVVITEETATKLFHSTHVLGRSIILHDAYDVPITGVIRPVPQPSHMGSAPENILRFDVLFTEDTYWAFRRAREPNLPPTSPFAGDAWGSPVSFTYALFPADGSFTARMLNDQLQGFTRRHVDATTYEKLHFSHAAIPIASLGLTRLDVDLFHGNGLSLSALILSLAIIVLGVASLNYANLSAAQTLTRMRELGLRRTLGASGIQIAAQEWIASGTQLFVALLLAVPIVILGVTWFGDDAMSTIGRVVAAPMFWFSTLGAITTVVFILGAYTAHVILRAYPIGALRGTTTQSGNGFTARLLVGIQFAVASMLIIALLVIRAQNNDVRIHALRGHPDPIVVLEFPGRDAGFRFDTLKTTLLQSGAIREVSGMIRTPWSTKQPSIGGIAIEPGETLRNALLDFVRYDFERALAIQVLAGRSFDRRLNDKPWPNTETKSTGPYPIVIDRATARELGWSNPGDAVNRSIYLPKWSDGHITGQYSPLNIIGIIESNPLRFDASSGMHLQIYALVPTAGSNVIVRVDKNRVAEALSAIDSAWKEFVPYAPVNRHFMDELFEREYRTLDLTNRIVTVLASIGTGIALMGLFGMAIFIAQRRRHEIGVRKTLGATTHQVIAMLLKDFSIPVLIANLLVWPFAFIAAQKYLSLFLERIDLTVWPFVLSLCVALVLACFAVGGQAWHAASLKPADVLRQE